MKQAVLEVKGLTKYFGDVAANKDISLSLDKHEILAIVGENGAGKSTFCKMLTGIYHPEKEKKSGFRHRLILYRVELVWSIRREILWVC